MPSKGHNLHDASGPLGRWYADPLEPGEAARLLDETERRLTRQYRRGGNSIGIRLLRMGARFWLEEAIAEEYALIRTLAQGAVHARALTELVYGQLLLSRRLATAWPHLERGFADARPLFAPADYFLVLNRHQILRDLPVTATAAEPSPLEDLMKVAKVAARIAGRSSPKSVAANPNDTFG